MANLFDANRAKLDPILATVADAVLDEIAGAVTDHLSYYVQPQFMADPPAGLVYVAVRIANKMYRMSLHSDIASESIRNRSYSYKPDTLWDNDIILLIQPYLNKIAPSMVSVPVINPRLRNGSGSAPWNRIGFDLTKD